MQSAPNRIETIDAMRVFAMIAVIQIHSPWYHGLSATELDVPTLLNQFARFAVPFFFLISGYLWGAKCVVDEDYWKRAVGISKRTIIIFCVWSLLYKLLFFVWVLRHDGVGGMLELVMRMVRPFDAGGLANDLLQGGKFHLWFLPSLAIAALISGAMLARRHERTLFALAIMLFAVGLAGSAYSSAPFGFTSRFNFRNGPFLALIMFVSGYAMQRHGQKVKLLPAGIALALGGFTLQLVESTLIHQHWGAPLMHDYVLGTYFFGLGMGMIALSNIPLLRIRAMTAIGPLMLGVYACHVFFVEKARPLEQFVHQSLFQELAYVAAVFLLSLGATFILFRWRYTRQFVT